jgi:Double-GTPase 1
MSTLPESEILLVGLTETGKTNFLVGLDVVLDNQVDPNGLVHSDHAADRAYLEPLRAQWMRGEQLKHTSRQAPPPPHQLLVRHPVSGTHATFHIPDLAGETFDSQFIARSLSHEFGMRVRRAAGIILFLHCAHEADHELLEHPQFMDTESTTDARDPTSIALAKSTDWSIEQASKQVKLVDLLQFATELRDGPLRIAIVISAWDRIERAPKGVLPKEPALFVAKLWPLLAHYLESNRDIFRFRMFGVSARGGGNSPEEIERLTKLTHPRDRVTIVDGDHRSSDLTRPVRWLLELLDAPGSSNA